MTINKKINQLRREIMPSKVQLNLTTTFLVAFTLINLMFILRLAALVFLHAGGWSVVTQFTVLILIAFLLVLTFLALRRIRWEQFVDYLQKRLAIVFIIASFVISAFGLDRAFAASEGLIRLEIWAWHFGILLWAIFFWFAVHIRQATQVLDLSDVTPSDSGVPSKFLKTRRIALVIIAGFLASYWVFFMFIRPAPYHIQYDPEVAYLANSLTPFTEWGMYTGRMDHPGTPLQLLGSTFYLLSYPLALFYPQSILDYRFLHPEVLLTLARVFLLTLNLSVLMIVVKHVFRPKSWGTLFAALTVGLLFFAVHPQAIEFLAIWSPNSFNFAAGTLLLLGLFLGMRSSIQFTLQQLFLLGFLAGIVATFQLYLAVWTIGLAITVFIYTRIQYGQGWRRPATATAAALLGSAFGFIASTLVIFRHYPSFLDWVSRLVGNQGIHGTGASGLISLEQLGTSLRTIGVTALPLAAFSMLVIAALIVLFVKLRRFLKQDYGLWSLSVGLIVQIGILFFIILRQPAHQYLLSVAATLPILVAIVFELVDRHFGLPNLRTYGALIIVLAGFSVMLLYNFQRHSNEAQALDIQMQEADRFKMRLYEELDEEDTPPILIWTYGTHSQCFVWSYANRFTQFRFASLVEENCPNDWYLNIFGGWVSNSMERAPLKEVENWDAIVATPRQRRLERIFNRLDQHPVSIDESFRGLVIISNRK